MKFYNRENELAKLESIRELSKHTAQMTFVTGRRRIGKTSLLVKSCHQESCLYFFIARKNEVLLCAEFSDEIRHKLKVPIFGELRSFKDLFGFLMDLSKTHHFTLIIDEFQEFMSVNPSIYSDMQNIWDAGKTTSKINLILCGSVYAMMTRIFEHYKEPLFGRATQRLHINGFNIATLKLILKDNLPQFTNEDLLAFYTFTGGVAKYVELLVQDKAFSFDRILDTVISENSLFLEEGKNILIDEFGKDYGNYFSLLTLIASGKTSRPEIESIMEITTGGFLDRLESEDNIIKKERPILSKPNSRSVKYSIDDNFLRFWFRFIYKYRSTLEIGNLNYLKDVIRRDYQTYSGKVLEKYFKEKLASQHQYNIIGSWWQKGNHNEIDIVAINDLTKQVLIAEVKINKSKLNLSKLNERSHFLKQTLQNYNFEYVGFSMDDM